MLGGLEELLLAFVAQYGFLALFIFLFLETSMLFPFIPSELTLLFAATLLVSNPMTFAAFVFVAAAGATIGSLFLYYVFDMARQPVIDRYGSSIHVSETDIERAGRWFRRWGESSVFWGRCLPVLRSVISIPAGLAGMRVGKFAVYSGAGSGFFAAGVAVLVVTGRKVLPTQQLMQWAVILVERAVASAVSHPPFVVAIGGLLLFAALLTRNAYSAHLLSR